MPSVAQSSTVPAAPISVTEVQKLLNDLGYAAGPEDGRTGPKTRAAIREFQTDAGLPATGALDSELLAILEAPGVHGGSLTEPSVIQGMETKLDSLGWAVGEIDGVVDRQLKIALTKYCRFAGIPVNHEPTLITLIHIKRHELRNDSQLASKLLWDVETELARRGYRTGFIDGTDDPLTFDAILDYEGDAGLPLNGQVNPILLDSLEIVDSRPVTMRDIDEIERRL